MRCRLILQSLKVDPGKILDDVLKSSRSVQALFEEQLTRAIARSCDVSCDELGRSLLNPASFEM